MITTATTTIFDTFLFFREGPFFPHRLFLREKLPGAYFYFFTLREKLFLLSVFHSYYTHNGFGACVLDFFKHPSALDSPSQFCTSHPRQVVGMLGKSFSKASNAALSSSASCSF